MTVSTRRIRAAARKLARMGHHQDSPSCYNGSCRCEGEIERVLRALVTGARFPRTPERAPFSATEPLIALSMSDVHRITRDEDARIREAGGFFLVLDSEPWRRFARGTKMVEVRRDIPLYQKIQPGRFGVMRRGHNGESLFAACRSRLRVENLAALPLTVRKAADLVQDRPELTA